MSSYRSFGDTLADLAVDFSTAHPPETVTRLLMMCRTGQHQQLDEAFYWSLSVGDRIAGLMEIWLAGGGSTLDIEMTCSAKACKEKIASALSVEALLEAHQETRQQNVIHFAVADRQFDFRKPKGSDQYNWLVASENGQPASFLTMVSDLLVEQDDWDAEMLDDQKVQLENAFQTADPLVDVAFDIECPACNSVLPCTVDLQHLLLQQFASIQRRMLRMVHVIASRYHWSEAEIFALPVWRRSHYLRLIQMEGAG